MLPQWVKDVYFKTFGTLSYVNLVGRRALWSVAEFRAPAVDGVRVLHLGCGPHYVPGFTNVEANLLRRRDLWLDFTLGLPFPDHSFDLCYASHVVEHVPLPGLRKLAAEVYRVLAPGGGVRWVTPSLRLAIEAYIAGDSTYFSDFPDRFESLGGRFNNYMLCQGQHRIMCDLSFMTELLAPAGFAEVRECAPAETHLVKPSVFALLPWEHKESEQRHRSLFIEARRPG